MANNINHPNLTLPEQTNYEITYGLAFKLAADRLNGLPDLAEQCRRSGSNYSTDRRLITLNYLNLIHRIALPAVDISLEGSSEKVALLDRILILNYLLRAKGTPLTNRLISYQELKEGAVYYPSFVKRAVRPLIDCFGKTPDNLLTAAAAMGAFPAKLGDVAVTIPAFSRVPVTIVLWKGDEEFPPNANILFDSTILDYLGAEDINVLCQTISWKLLSLIRAVSPKPGSGCR